MANIKIAQTPISAETLAECLRDRTSGGILYGLHYPCLRIHPRTPFPPTVWGIFQVSSMDHCADSETGAKMGACVVKDTSAVEPASCWLVRHGERIDETDQVGMR
jgi:hypothetical protein